MTVTQEILHQLLGYDPKTGRFTWRERARHWFDVERDHKKWNTRYAGTVAGTYANGYIRIRIIDRGYSAHRLAWLYVYGVWPEKDTDHINRIKDDNRIENLRAVSRSVNKQNRGGAQPNSASGFLGAYPHRDRFQSTIKLNGKQHHLGMYDTAKEAHMAYLKAKAEMHEGYVA